jgi:hypothetical protein
MEGSVDEKLKALSVDRLSWKVPPYLWSHYRQESAKGLTWVRYALIEEQGQLSFVIWETGQRHGIMKGHLRRLGLKWIKSGYLAFEKRENDPRLLFSATTLDDGTDIGLRRGQAQALFQQAFNRALRDNTDLAMVLKALQPKVSFETFEDHGDLQLVGEHP